MARGIAAFIAGLGTGALNQYQRQQDMDRQAKKDQMEQEDHDVRMEEARRKQTMQRELAGASADVEVTQGAGGATLPASADNRDVGQADGATVDNGQVKTGVRVGDKAYADPAAGQLAATAANTPAARAARQGAVLAKYDPLAAAQLRSANASATNSEQALADRAVRDRLTGMTSFEDLANFISETPADGKQGGLKVQPVLNPDKTVGFVKVNPDGTSTPLPGTYANSELGLEQARMKVAGYSTPEMRMAHYQWQTAQDQHAREFEETKDIQKAQLAELARNHRATEANQATLTAVHQATLQFQKDKARLDDPTYNLPPAVKLQTQGLQKQVLAAQEQLAKAMAADPNWDENSKGAMALKGQIASANLKLQGLVEKYIPAAKGAPAGGADPAGVRSAPAAAPAAPQPGRPMAAQGIPAATPAAPAAAPAQAAPVVPLPDAQAAFKAAQSTLATFGMRQRAQDPQGFAQAQAQVAAAQAALEAAQQRASEEARRTFASPAGPAIVTAQP